MTSGLMSLHRDRASPESSADCNGCRLFGALDEGPLTCFATICGPTVFFRAILGHFVPAVILGSPIR